MMKKVFISGSAGSLVLVLWTFLINGVFGFNARLTMKPVPNEREVYSTLKAAITEPGAYLCNPALTSDGRFPEHEPVFGIEYSGVGHEAAGLGAVQGLLEFLFVPLIGAGLLSTASERFRSRMFNRVSFFAAIGILSAITGDLNRFGIGGAPMTVAMMFAARTVVTWTILGLVVGALLRPGPQEHATR